MHLGIVYRLLNALIVICIAKLGCDLGDWGSGDDRRLLKALLRTGATHEFQVDWGNLIARNAAQTRRRWRLMLKCVKNATDHEFHENLHTLVQNFTPDLLPSDSAVEGAAAAAPADIVVEGA